MSPSNRKLKKYIGIGCMSLMLFTTTIIQSAAPVFAEVDYLQEQENRKLLPIQSNEIENWPDGPAVGAEGAILIEANTGTILYSKNIHERLYPASTTKILSTLVAIENSSLDEVVDFSNDAVFSIEQGSSNMGMDVGQSITMEQCLYGILVYSANEVTNAVAEHIAGSMDTYVEMMNKRAAELGCTESHFVTTNGLHDENHYTTPYDLALIGKAFFANETLAKMSGTASYVIEPTPTQPDLIELYTHNKLINRTYPYDYLVGSKTGFTSDARQTLVSCAEKDGMKLICVVMKEESPEQFTDTISLFDYGFNNFQMVNVSENETQYTVNSSDFFDTDNDIFGSSDPIISIDPDATVVIPNTIDFTDISSTLSYDAESDATIATINYAYQDVPVGTATVNLEVADAATDYEFDGPVATTENTDETTEEKENIIFINIIKIFSIVVAIVFLLASFFILRSFFKNYHFNRHRRKRVKKTSDSDFKMTNRRHRLRDRRKAPKYKIRDSYKDIDFRRHN